MPPRYRPTNEPPEPMRRGERDLTTMTGAELLAQELDEWWHSRGYPQVKHRVESLRVSKLRAHGKTSISTRLDKQTSIWCVRSNLVGGLPPPPEMT